MTTHEAREYDIAVSFAGEQREFVEAFVRGLGPGVRAFYDKDEKAQLLGENLVDLLTDVYQNQARYVAMFVSAAYAEKMWTNIERQSAMAQAAQRRVAYILPVRMDDTPLPGLLPTVGYIDARVEGLDGVIKIIRDKIGLDAPPSTYQGRVPTTQAEIALLLTTRPAYWEYWLYAGTIRIGLEALEEKFRDYELGYASLTGVAYTGQAAVDFLRSAPNRSTALIRNFSAILRSDAQQRAFGLPGQAGDAEQIIHLARRFVETYEAFLDEAIYFRGATLPPAFVDAQLAAGDFGTKVVAEIRDFAQRLFAQMNDLPELMAASTPQNPVESTATLTFDVDDDVIERFTAGIAKAVESLG